MPMTVMFEIGELDFDQWKELVDAEFTRVTMDFTSEDFVDWHYATAFEDGVEPRDAAREAMAQDALGRSYLELAGVDPDEVAL